MMIGRLVVLALCIAAPLVPATLDAAPPRAPRPPDAPEAPEPPEPPMAPEPPGFAFAFASASASGRARIGVHVSSMTPELRKFLGAKEDAGILVQRVDPDTPAARAGIKVGDVIVSVDGDAIDEIGEVAPAIADHGKGEKIEVVVLRKKARKRLRVALQDDAMGEVGMPAGFPFGEGRRDEIETLRRTIEALEKRVDQLDRARRRASTSKR